MSKKAANEPPNLASPLRRKQPSPGKRLPTGSKLQSKAKAPPPPVSKPQSKPPGRFERLLRKKRSAKEAPSAAVAAPRQQVQPAKPPSPATQPPGRFESLMRNQLSANEPPSAAPSRQQALPTNKPSSLEGATQLPQARSPGRFESLMQKQLSTKEPPSSSATAAPLPPANPPSPSEGVHRSTGRFESLMQQQLSTKEPSRSVPSVAPPSSPQEAQSTGKTSLPKEAKPLPQARPPGKFELLMQQQREKSESKSSPRKSNSEAKSSTPPVHSEPRGWDPKKEIDTNRVDSIKAMWGAKAAGSQPRLPTGSSRKF
ncbi:hypothetical protein ACHAXT_004635 [Thalassiosira profunda]